ncbi:hypothetical protein [Streptomyces olivaceoviridis]|uniref:hypothetical protein n=1 Tax=Streptomyces olivaceoviridis TaxID=1921 RepID=UPI003679AB2C
MTSTDQQLDDRPPSTERSIRPVVEHALTDYGYSAETTRILIARLITEGRAE